MTLRPTLLAALLLASHAHAAEPLIIAEQGSFAVGGTIKRSEGTYDPYPAITRNAGNPFWEVYKASVAAGGQTLHGDHASVFYQIPVNARRHPLVFLHGHGQSARTWQTTPDGREGFQNLFLRMGYPVYLVDQPRRGQAARSTEKSEISATPDDQFWYAQFRIGVYPARFDGAAFPAGKAAEEQFFRMMTPDTGSFDIKVITDGMAKLFDKTGGGVFVTHSAGGLIGWTTAMQSANVKGIIAIEPGAFPFPEGQTPPVMKNGFGDVAPMSAPAAEFAKLTRIPIVIYFGDFIPDAPNGAQGSDQWHIRLKLAQQWAEVVNRHGGDVQVVRLPETGIRGNTHFPMSDTNNAQVAAIMAKWLKAKGLE